MFCSLPKSLSSPPHFNLSFSSSPAGSMCHPHALPLALSFNAHCHLPAPQSATARCPPIVVCRRIVACRRLARLNGPGREWSPARVAVEVRSAPFSTGRVSDELDSKSSPPFLVLNRRGRPLRRPSQNLAPGVAQGIHREHVAGEGERMGVDGNLTDEQLQSFHSQGFLVVDSFCGKEEIDAMMGRMNHLLDNFDCSSASVSSTENQKQIADDFLFESADKISFFVEEKAFDDKGILKQPKQLSINRVGHALHEIDPVFRKYSHSEKIAGLLISLGYRRPVIIQSMYIFKQAGIGGEVVPHQDSSFVYTDPPSCTGLWLGLEDATIANGCLWAIPGSHKNGLVRRFIRDDNGVHFDKPSPSYDPRDFVPLEVKAGSLIVLHGELVHQSFANQSLKSRHAYSVHAVETDGCSWAADNWMRKAEPEPLYSS